MCRFMLNFLMSRMALRRLFTGILFLRIFVDYAKTQILMCLTTDLYLCF